MSLEGKRVLVTAGGGNVGRRIVALFHAEGASVVAADINSASGQHSLRNAWSSGKGRPS